MTSVVWFRQDLRLRDNPALAAAAARGPVLPVFILDDVTPGPWRWGAASRWWLHHSLAALRRDIGQLTLLRGDAREVLPAWIRRTGATAVHWNRCYEPFAIARDTALKAALQADGIDVHSHNGSLLREPWEVATADGGPFRVYTPFWRACMAGRVADPLPVPPLAIDRSAPAGDALEDWSLQPVKPNWAAGWERFWQPGEAGALARLEDFIADNLAEYEGLRDWPGLDMTSRLSPHLHWGEISPRQVWTRVGTASRVLGCEDSVDKFFAEIGWREFAHHLLYHFPQLPERNWRSAFDAYPWRNDRDDLTAWQRGRTGYPLVDAGMRELWQTGWMHNRVRMVAASFLVKHLRIDWRIGEAWFWDTLVDADLANNAAGWQWVAGSGADAAPYFRIFNPVTQGRKFDPHGDYVRRWCPELAHLPDERHPCAVRGPARDLGGAGVELGRTYPRPIVDHERSPQGGARRL